MTLDNIRLAHSAGLKLIKMFNLERHFDEGRLGEVKTAYGFKTPAALAQSVQKLINDSLAERHGYHFFYTPPNYKKKQGETSR
jgi:hypothetical protein